MSPVWGGGGGKVTTIDCLQRSCQRFLPFLWLLAPPALKWWSWFAHSWNLGWPLSNGCGNSVLGFPSRDLQVLTWTRGDTICHVKKSRLLEKAGKRGVPRSPADSQKGGPRHTRESSPTPQERRPQLSYAVLRCVNHSSWSAALCMWPSWILQPHRKPPQLTPRGTQMTRLSEPCWRSPPTHSGANKMMAVSSHYT